MNENVIARIKHNEYEDFLLNNKCLRRSMNKIQGKNQEIGTYEIKKISLSCFDDKYISKTINVMDKLLVIRVEKETKVF